MTLPVFISAGTGSTSSVAWPTHAAGDFGMLFTETDTTSVPTPSGWTLISPFPIAHVVVNTKLQVFYRFATSSSESNAAISGADHAWGTILTFSGVNPLTPLRRVATSIGGASRTTHCADGLTTYLDDSLIVFALCWNIDNAGPLFTSIVSTDVTSPTIRYDAGTTSGDGGGLMIVTGTQAFAGYIRDGVWTISTASRACCATIALVAVDKNFGAKSRVVNKTG